MGFRGSWRFIYKVDVVLQVLRYIFSNNSVPVSMMTVTEALNY